MSESNEESENIKEIEILESRFNKVIQLSLLFLLLLIGMAIGHVIGWESGFYEGWNAGFKAATDWLIP